MDLARDLERLFGITEADLLTLSVDLVALATFASTFLAAFISRLRIVTVLSGLLLLERLVSGAGFLSTFFFATVTLL